MKLGFIGCGNMASAMMKGILDKKLLAAAFRRKIAPMVEGTEKYTENEGHRPSQLFCKRR